MSVKNFKQFADAIQKYLETNKTGTINKVRCAELRDLAVMARNLFPDTNVRFEDDPLQLGRIILCIEGYDISVCGESDIRTFAELVSTADNFEISAKGDEKVEVAIMYGGYMDITIK